MGELRQKTDSKPRLSVTEWSPSEHAPSNFYAKDMARRRTFAGSDVPGEDDESDFGNCCQCNAPQRLSEADTCYNCGSDNREGIRLPSNV